MTDEVRPWLAMGLLALLIAVAYAPSASGDFLGYDDDWLIRDNPVMADATAHAPAAIFSDFSRDTRLALGAEYLPVRDLVTWGAVRMLGPNAPALRLLLIVLYIGAALVWRRWLVALLGAGTAAELAALAFALHPAHAESVAWLAGFKDVLALAFTGLALATYTSGSLDARRRMLVVLFVVLACFSKAVAVVTPALLLCVDAWRERRPDRATILASFVVAGLAGYVHTRVGAEVGMYAALPGGSRLGALATVAPVAWRYVARVLLVEPASIVYEVPDRTIDDPVAIGCLAAAAIAALAVVVAARRGEPRPLVLAAFALAALAPVSQVLAPIQHRMADRYLLIALAAPCIALGVLVAHARAPRVRWGLASVIILVLMLATSVRAWTLATPMALWIETSERAPSSPVGPYQIGAMLERTQPVVAERAYGEALARDGMRSDTGRRAADNLAILLAGSGRAPGAIALLERTHAQFPNDPHVGHNLAVLLDEAGAHERARSLMLEVITRTPRYEHARSWYRERWGEPPVSTPAGSTYDTRAP